MRRSPPRFSPQRDLRRHRPSCRRARGSTRVRSRKHPTTTPHPTEDFIACAGAALLAWETLPALYPTVERPPLTSVVRFGVRFAHRSSARIASLINLCWHPFARSVAAAAPATGLMRSGVRFASPYRDVAPPALPGTAASERGRPFGRGFVVRGHSLHLRHGTASASSLAPTLRSVSRLRPLLFKPVPYPPTCTVWLP